MDYVMYCVLFLIGVVSKLCMAWNTFRFTLTFQLNVYVWAVKCPTYTDYIDYIDFWEWVEKINTTLYLCVMRKVGTF